MSSWSKKAGGRRPPPTHSAGRSFRRTPYPMREDRKDDHPQSESFECLDEGIDYSGPADYEHSPHQSTAVSPEEYEASVQRNAIYERFFQQLHGDGARQPADCVVLSVNNQNVSSKYAQRTGHGVCVGGVQALERFTAGAGPHRGCGTGG
uniref:Nuclear receptor coactivator 5-like n=1 Tax=Cyprinus carpio TaxID=7962 RepID=A0A8C1IWH9_CYPCA